MQNRPQSGTAGSEADAFPNTLLTVGISVLFLLAGPAFAFKVKH